MGYEILKHKVLEFNNITTQCNIFIPHRIKQHDRISPVYPDWVCDKDQSGTSYYHLLSDSFHLQSVCSAHLQVTTLCCVLKTQIVKWLR